MEVILKEDVTKLGHRGDVVKVADGYGRNYLLPGKLAIEATAANKAVIEQMKSSAVRKSAKEKAQSEELSKQMAQSSSRLSARSAKTTSCSAPSPRATSPSSLRARASRRSSQDLA